MTVQELIARLQTMPPDAVVIYRACSDWQAMEADEVDLITAGESEVKVKEQTERRLRLAGRHRVSPTVPDAVCLRGGMYREAYTLDQHPPGEEPVHVDVVTFPGN